MLKATSKSSFKSDQLGRRIRRGEEVVGDDAYMRELHRLGLVGAPSNKMLQVPENKSGNQLAAGAEQQPFASPAALVLQPQTVESSRRRGGAGRQKP